MAGQSIRSGTSCPRPWWTDPARANELRGAASASKLPPVCQKDLSLNRTTVEDRYPPIPASR